MDRQAKMQANLAPPSPRSGVRLPMLPKGKSGNPKGYPAKLRERDEFRRLCAELWATGRADLVEAIRDGVKRRKFDFVREGMERFFGKVPNKNENSGPNGGPMQMQISVAGPDAQRRIEELKARLQ